MNATVSGGIRMSSAGGRAMIESAGRLIDVAARSGGKFSSDPMALLSQWDTFADWARRQTADGSEPAVDAVTLDVCVPRPRS